MRSVSANAEKNSFSLHRMWSIVDYELKWDIRKKKVLFVTSFTFAVIILAVALFRSFSNNGFYGNSENLWSTIILVLTNGFISGIFPMVIGGVIAVDSIAWEIDKGTILLLLSQPVRRSEIYFGKFTEKLLVMFIISLLLVFFSVILSSITAGYQEHLIWIIPTAASFLLEVMVFISFTFMLGALVKQSGFMMLMLTGIYFLVLIGSVFLMLKDRFHMWMTFIPLAGVNNLLMSLQHFSIEPGRKVFLNYDLGPTMSGGVWVYPSQLLIYSIAGAMFSIVVFTIIGYALFSRLEIKG
mgnify:CR=1 FL=1